MKKRQKSIVKITIGTVIGQLSIMMSTPIISRFYTPEELGYLVVFTSLVGLVTTISALHYELAIPLPKTDAVVSNLISICLIILFSFSFLIFLFVFISGKEVLEFFNAEVLFQIRYLLPISFLILGLSIILLITNIREHNHTEIAISKALKGCSQAVLQTGAGLAGMNWKFLVVGQVMASGISLTTLLPNKQMRKITFRLSKRKRQRMMALVKKYKNFPLAAVPSSIVNSLAANAPTIMLAALFGPNVAGLYGLGVRVLQLPIGFVGQSISQVFLGSAPTAHRNNELAPLVEGTFYSLSCLSLYTFIPLSVFAPAAFSLFFGENWNKAGVYTQCLTPWLLLLFISTPLSMLVTVLEKQVDEFRIQIVWLLLLCLSLCSGYIVEDSMVSVTLLGLSGFSVLMFKCIWLMNIAECDMKLSLLKFLREFAFAIVISSTLLILEGYNYSDTVIVIAGIIIISLIHLVNYKYRNCYEF